LLASAYKNSGSDKPSRRAFTIGGREVSVKTLGRRFRVLANHPLRFFGEQYFSKTAECFEEARMLMM
jgi:hypothetical protein